MSKVNVKFENNKIEAGFDGNEDGENSLTARLSLQEVYEELLKKGEVKVEAVLTYKLEGTKIKAFVDTDKDGEPVLEVEADLIEGFEELTQKKSE